MDYCMFAAENCFQFIFYELQERASLRASVEKAKRLRLFLWKRFRRINLETPSIEKATSFKNSN